MSFASELGDELHIVIAFGNSQSLLKIFFFQVEAFRPDSSEEEEARVAAERRKRSIRRPPKIHAQVGDPEIK